MPTTHLPPQTNAPALPDPARLFLALWPAPAWQRALHAWAAPWLQRRASAPVATPRLHLTLHFIGPVPREPMARLEAALQVRMRGFELQFSRCVQWPHGLLVTEPDAVPQALTELQAALGTALQDVGLPVEERAFRPHVTLARRHVDALPPPLDTPLHWRVDHYALVESRHAPHREYVVLHRYRGAGRAALSGRP